MNAKASKWAIVVGSILQLAMVTTGHLVPPVQSMFLWGGLFLSAIAGAIYARMARGSLSSDAVAGLVSGGACAFAGILVSCALGDVPALILVVGTVSSAVTGSLGAVVAHYLR